MRAMLVRMLLFLLIGWATVPDGARAQSDSPPTDLLTAEESRRAGLEKLSPEELAALNEGPLRVLSTLIGSAPGVMPGDQSSRDVLELFDSQGDAIAFIDLDEDLTIYLWNGDPVAYLDDESIFGFNGDHLGWFQNGAVYDHDGDIVVALAERFTSPPVAQRSKGLRGLKPLKGLKELRPLRPLFGMSWADISARMFFLEGIR